MEFELVSPLNKKQILLDWINTIDEPNCLLAGCLEDLKDGQVFLEIINHYLKINKKDHIFATELKLIENYQNHEKFDLIINMLKILSDDNEYFDYISYDKMLISEDCILDFIYQIKKLYCGKETNSLFEENKNYSYSQEEGKSNIENKKNLVKNSIRKNEYFESSNDKKKLNIDSSSKKDFFEEKILINNDIDIINNINYDENNRKNSNLNDISENELNFPLKKLNNKISKNTNSAKDQEYKYINTELMHENYIISDSFKTSNNQYAENYQEISNDYIQSTSNNNYLHFNSNITNYSNQSNNNYVHAEFLPIQNRNKVMKGGKNLSNERQSNIAIQHNELQFENYQNTSRNKLNAMQITHANEINIVHSNTDCYNPENLKIIKPTDTNSNYLEFTTSNRLKTSKSSNVSKSKLGYQEDKRKKEKSPLKNYNKITNNPVISKREGKLQKEDLNCLNDCEKKNLIKKNKENLEENINKLQNFRQIKQNKTNIEFNRSKISLEKSDNSSLDKSPHSKNRKKFPENLEYFSNEQFFSKKRFFEVSPSGNTSTRTEMKYKKFDPITIERTQLYLKNEISQMNNFMGLISNKNKFEWNSQKLDYFLFHKPTTPILKIDYDNIDKYKLKHTLHISNERFVNISYDDQINKIYNENKRSNKKFEEESDKIILREKLSRSPIRQSNKTSKFSKTDFDSKFIRNDDEFNKDFSVLKEISRLQKNELKNFERENDGNFDDYDSIEDSVPINLKNKIMNWLISLNMVKEEAIKNTDLPRMCANGVFISDLVNRLEGRTETIKGIIRKTLNRSHIQVNINKLLDYLRSLGKFNARHLWSNTEICCADPKTIWELLDDIWHFYSNKKLEYKRDKSKSSNGEKMNFQNDINKNKQNSVSSTLNQSGSLNRNNQLNKLREINTFSPINRDENKYDDINTNSDIFNGLEIDTKMNLKTRKKSDTEKSTKKYSISTNRSNFNINNTYNENVISSAPKTENSNHKKINSINKKNLSTINSNNLTQNNRDVIVNYLGIESSKIPRKERLEKINANSISNIVSRKNNFKRNEFDDISLMNNNKSNEKIPNHLKYKDISKINCETQNSKSTKHNKSADNFNKCFVIFNKTNVFNLKKEIQRYDSKNGTIDNEIFNLSGNNDESRKKNQSNLRSNNSSNFITNLSPITSNLTGYNDITNKSRYILSSPENRIEEYEENNHKKLSRYIINLADSKTKIEKDDVLLREWLDFIGVKNTYLIDFTKDELSEFRDGLLLGEIVSILENKKIKGLNPNPKCMNSRTLNISKVLEILRNKKNMPYDHLWNEEEIYKGNTTVIIELIKQIKKAYSKETEHLTKNNKYI